MKGQEQPCENLEVKKSPIEGSGIFASRAFHKGDVICRFSGKRIGIPQLRKMFLNGDKRVACDAFQIKEREYLLLKKPFVYFNHSCSPNSGIKDVRTLAAVKDIAIGEEITYDYAATEWTPYDYTEYDHTVWPMKCNCQSPVCRKLVGSFYQLPKNIRSEYLQSGVIQDYIKRKVADLGDLARG